MAKYQASGLLEDSLMHVSKRIKNAVVRNKVRRAPYQLQYRHSLNVECMTLSFSDYIVPGSTHRAHIQSITQRPQNDISIVLCFSCVPLISLHFFQAIFWTLFYVFFFFLWLSVCSNYVFVEGVGDTT